MLSPEEKQAVVDLFPFLSENPVVFDCGSNKGHFSEIFIQEYKDKCRLFLFEPNRMLLDYTRIKFEYDKNVSYFQLGISDKSGDREFYYFENHNNEISSVYPDKEGWVDLPMKENDITTISIDDYFKQCDISYIDFLKLDIEGSEVEAMIGAINSLKEEKIKIIQIEYGGHYVRADRKFQEVIDLVTPLGYKIYKYVDGNFYELKDFVEDYAAENYYITKEEIHNYSSDGGWKNAFILSTVDLPKFDLMLEVGAFEGITTKYMVENMLNPGGRVIVVDPLMDEYIKGDTTHPYFKGQYQRFLRNTRGLPIELKRGDSEIELPKLNALRFGFCFIDGNHWPPWPYFDGSWCFAITKIGGYILFDDVNLWSQDTHDSVYKFLKEFSNSLEIVREDYQVLVKKTNNQYNSITNEYYR